MSKRKAISERMKLMALFYRNEIFCDWCGVQIISTDVIRWDHFNPLGMGGDHDYTNLQPLHVKCHDEKTRGTGATTAGSDIGKIAKVKRLIRKAAGTWRKTRRPIPSRPFLKCHRPMRRKVPHASRPD